MLKRKIINFIFGHPVEIAIVIMVIMIIVKIYYVYH